MQGSLHSLKTKADFVNLLNSEGRFWEYCNQATDRISDDELIFKSLLFLEFEDIEQLFDLYPRERCRKIWKERIASQRDYYGIIAFLLGVYFFSDAEESTIGSSVHNDSAVSPSLQELLGVKIFLAYQRNDFADYYDIFRLLENGCDIYKGVDFARRLSGSSVHTKGLVSNLLAPSLFRKRKDSDEGLRVIYSVPSEEIAERISSALVATSKPLV